MSYLISVIMPAYNADDFVQKAIKSILNQTHQNFELLIADDGSLDNTRSLIDSFQDNRIKFYYNDVNLGYLKTCNKLLALCKGDFITFQDADDWSEPNRLECQVSEFIADPQLGICGSWANYVSLKKAVIREKKTPLTNEDILSQSKIHNPFCGASIMIKKEVYKIVGGYQEYFDRIGNEDYDWSLRIIDKFKASNIPEALYNVRINSDSVSRTIKTPKQLISSALVHFLADQRKKYQQDSLTGLDKEYLLKFEEKLLNPFEKDKALMYRKAADIAAFNNDVKNLKKNAWLAWKASPTALINNKYFLSSILKF